MNSPCVTEAEKILGAFYDAYPDTMPAVGGIPFRLIVGHGRITLVHRHEVEFREPGVRVFRTDEWKPGERGQELFLFWCAKNGVSADKCELENTMSLAHKGREIVGKYGTLFWIIDPEEGSALP